MPSPVPTSVSARQRARALLPLPALCLLAACGQESPPPAGTASPNPTPPPAAEAPAAEPDVVAADGCAPDPGIDYLCGPRNAEDLLRLGDSRWLLASGMNGQVSGGDFSGQLHLVDSETRTFSVVFPGEEPRLEQDMQAFPDCPGPLDVQDFSAHGLALREVETGRQRLYMTSHGAREAIEVFDIDTSQDTPVVAWVGCVLLPETAWSNSVTITPDGGFYATQFLPAGETLEPVLAREITGHVFEWHPGSEVIELEGSDLSGPNGIVLDEARHHLYVAAYGTQEVLRFDLNSTPPGREAVALDIHPDNLRWTPEGTLYAAGAVAVEGCEGEACAAGWGIVEIQPEGLTARRIAGAGPEAAMQGISVALKVNDEIWVGTYAGDRIGILPAPAP